MNPKPTFEKLLRKFRERATTVSHEDIRSRLSQAIRDHYEALKGEDEYGCWCYVVAVLGDDKSGDVVYFADGDMLKASYTLRTNDSKATAKVDCENAVEVAPITTYLPREAATTEAAADIALVGDVIPLKEGSVGMDGSVYLKIIAPGRGSSGYYPEAVLERDGPKIFKKGTKNYWNHQTEAEEAARPEGDLRDLASVLTEDAHYEKKGPAGPGLYARAEVFEQFRSPVDSLAEHIGMSIRATGRAVEGKAPDGKTGPIIQELNRGISVDYVTTPGAGGKILQLFEAARTKPVPTGDPTPIEENAMNEAEFKKLQESSAALLESNKGIMAELTKLRERAAIADAGVIVAKYFATVRVDEAIRVRVTARILSGTLPMTEAGVLDADKLQKLAEAETKDEVAYIQKITGGVQVAGLGSTIATPTAEEIQREAADQAKEMDAVIEHMPVTTKAGRDIMREGRGAFRIEYNSAKENAAVLSGGKE